MTRRSRLGVARVGAGLAASSLAIGALLSVACKKEDRPSSPIVDIDTGIAAETWIPDGRPDTGPVTDLGGETGGDSGDAVVASGCPKGYSEEATPTAVSYPKTGTTGQQLAGLTWDELTMAWTTGDSTAGVVVHYSDRAKRDDPFTTDRTLPTTLGPFPQEKVALSADGLKMIFPSTDHLTIKQISRASRGVAFDESTVTSAPFALLMTSSEGGAKRQMADLVLSRDDKWLFFTDLGRTVGSTTMLSVKMSDGRFDAPSSVDGTGLAIVGGKRRRPTGFSADGRALFLWDEGTYTAFVAFTAPGSAVFSEIVAFAPTGTGASPNEACDRVYQSMQLPGDAGADAKPTVDPPAIFWVP